MLFVGKCENLVKAPTEIDDLQGAFNDSANAPEQGTCGIQVRIRRGWWCILEILKPQGSHVGFTGLVFLYTGGKPSKTCPVVVSRYFVIIMISPYLLMTVQPAGILLVPYSAASAAGFVNVPEDAT